MKIKYKFLMIFCLLTIATLGVTSHMSFKATESAIEDSAIDSMKNELNQVVNLLAAFHEKSESELVMAVNYPVFNEYFELADTKKGNVYSKEGVIQFTESQIALLDKINDWTLFIQERFPIEETCLIDKTGQEHTRSTHGELAPHEDYSAEEDGAGFFHSAYELEKNEVHVEYPYMSPDAEKWVFAYVSPIVLDDGSKPAFYHFEMAVELFQENIKGTTGRIFILDQKDLVIADSTRDFDMNMKGDGYEEEQLLADYIPGTDSISSAKGFKSIVADMKEGREGSATYIENGVKYYVAYKSLPTFGWSIATIKSYGELLEGENSLNKLYAKIITIVLIGLLISIILIILATETITGPLKELTLYANRLSSGDIHAILPESKTKDEVTDLAEGMKGCMAAIEFLTDTVESSEKKSKWGVKMGQKLLDIYEKAKNKGGIKSQVRLAMITKMSSVKAKEAEDSEENVKRFEQALLQV